VIRTPPESDFIDRRLPGYLSARVDGHFIDGGKTAGASIFDFGKRQAAEKNKH
jgi:hypothetical protein